MTSTFVVPPTSLNDLDHDPATHQPYPSANPHAQSTTSFDSSHLSPLLSGVEEAESLSPITHHLETPAGSNSTLSHFPPSDFSDLEEDPFFGADFGAVEGDTPSFLEDSTPAFEQVPFPAFTDYNDDNSTYPLTPEQTASLHTTSPRSDMRGAIKRPNPDQLPQSISPQELQRPFNQPPPIITGASDSAGASQLTPSQSSSCRSSEDGLAPAVIAMTCQSPRVTVSMWGKDDDHVAIHPVERSFDEGSPTTVRGGFELAEDFVFPAQNNPPVHSRDSIGRWRSLSTGHRHDPDNRSQAEVSYSINEMAARRETDDRKDAVGKWLTDKFNDLSVQPDDQHPDTITNIDRLRVDPEDRIPFNEITENRAIPGQTYYTGNGGPLSQQDEDIIAANRNWGDTPLLRTIRTIAKGEPGRSQPESSQAAIERFERMIRDSDTNSLLSRTATWGTRRRSFSGITEFDQGATTGNILKKLSLSRGDAAKKPGGGLLRDLRGLVRRPSASQLLKRNRTGNEEDSQPTSEERGSQESKRESTPHLVPLARIPSWGKKQSTPSINTALVSMGHNIASVASAHSRSGSISATPITSPKSPFGGLSVKGALRRPRSKSDLPRTTPSIVPPDSHNNLVSMWRETGGPPVVAALAKGINNNNEADDEDDEDDEFMEDSDMKMDANLIDSITPNASGFTQHVLTLNPSLGNANQFLVARIARHQEQRYKNLLNSKIGHLKLGATCPSGILCVALGGSANVLDQSGDFQELDPLSTGNDGDGSPTEGAINPESFPPDIPMPPTDRLPAEFECQLCYSSKKFQKPSDWTKHVHEDVQPFTCTWDKCRDPKMFKRKADWVRHENEGHRHLEWWICDVEGCRHKCFRRDNFLQHLVREHKFSEPKQKTKAAMKKAGGMDPTWQKVEQCHVETHVRPQEEPCRFCGKMFPTWKKLTVHLAKHMEQISLPVLRLVEAREAELKADTVISPVHDPPPSATQTTPLMQFPTHHLTNTHQPPYQHPGLGMVPIPFQHSGYFQPPFDSIGQSMEQVPPGMQQLNAGFGPAGQMADVPVTTSEFVQMQNTAFMSMQNNVMEPYSQVNALGLQNHPGPMGQMSYDGLIDPSAGTNGAFNGQGSISPYGHSPAMNGNNNRDSLWGDKQAGHYQ